MFIAFNGLIVFIIVLIAYWWANQGLFSALLHLLCMVIAGVIALAVWEPLTVNYLLGIKTLDDYAWGISLISVFVVVGLVLRIITNKVIPANVQVPHWADLVFGGILGAASGIFSMGIVMIGAGHVQAATEIMEYRGVARDDRTSQIPDGPPQKMWIPAHEWTYQALSLLSRTSLSTRTPLAEYNPHIDFQAASLLRDSYKDGRGKLSLDPDDATVDRFQLTADRQRAAVTVSFRGRSLDYGEMLTISKSQVRLILDNGRAVHPFGWSQRVQEGGTGHFRFDHESHYATSVPGTDSTTIMFKFNLASAQDSYGGSPGTGTPRFIQIRGTRFRLPTAGAITDGELQAGADLAATNTPAAVPTGSAPNINSAIRMDGRLRGVTISTNQLSGMSTVRIEDTNYLSEGRTEVRPGGPRPGANLRVQGIYEPPNTRIIQIDIARSSPANLFDRSLTERTKAGDELRLVDSTGQTYSPIGYVHRRPDQIVVIELDPQNRMPTMDKLPALPTSGDHQLWLVFQVTQGVTLQALMLGDVTVGTCSLAVTADT